MSPSVFRTNRGALDTFPLVVKCKFIWFSIIEVYIIRTWSSLFKSGVYLTLRDYIGRSKEREFELNWDIG